jgi:hypothetical protein
MVVCEVCQHQNPVGVEYCEECGAALVPVKIPVTAAASAANAATAAAPASAPSATDQPGPTGSTTTETPPPNMTPAESWSTASATPQTASADPGQSHPRLVMKRFGAVTEEEFPLMADRLAVGRFDPETGPVDIDLSEAAGAEHISRHHGELYRESDGRWFVRDLGSTNGVFVKPVGESAFGPRITEPRPLSNDDELAFGNVRFIFKAA